MDDTKPSYNPIGPFKFLPNPNSRLVDRRGSLPVKEPPWKDVLDSWKSQKFYYVTPVNILKDKGDGAPPTKLAKKSAKPASTRIYELEKRMMQRFDNLEKEDRPCTNEADARRSQQPTKTLCTEVCKGKFLSGKDYYEHQRCHYPLQWPALKTIITTGFADPIAVTSETDNADSPPDLSEHLLDEH